MKKYSVIFSDKLSDQDCFELAESIKKFSGVIDIYPEDDMESENITSATSYIKPPGYRSMEQNDTQETYSKSAAQSTEDFGSKTSRAAINYAVKYAVKQGLINLDEIKSMSPEKLVSFALQIIEKLPVEEKKKLGKQLNPSN